MLYSKVIVVGSASTGKTSLVQRFMTGRFLSVYMSTIGTDFFYRTIAVKEAGRVRDARISIWDTAGQEIFRSITKAYFRGAAAAIVAYDTTDRESFEGVSAWVEEIRQANGEDPVVIMLVGTKCDKREQRQVSKKEAQAYARENGFMFSETSAKTAANIDHTFYRVAKEVLKRENVEELPPVSEQTQKNCCFVT